MTCLWIYRDGKMKEFVGMVPHYETSCGYEAMHEKPPVLCPYCGRSVAAVGGLP